MLHTILIAPDGFKGCASSVEVASLIKSGLNKKLKGYDIKEFPVSDGGEGFVDVCFRYFEGEKIVYEVSNCYSSDLLSCEALYCETKKSVFIESAQLIGLSKIPVSFRKPLLLNTGGIGELLTKIRDDISCGKLKCEELYLGIGDTGTMDIGLGMCSQLGLRLFGSRYEEIKPLPVNYNKIKEIDWHKTELPFKINCVVDTHIDFLNSPSIFRIFGKQKSASDKDILFLENTSNKTIKLLKDNGLIDPSKNLNGAGGGLAAALQIFYNAEIISAERFILEILGLKNSINNSSIIITGEGRFDNQSFLGKGTGSIVSYAVSMGKSVIVICGENKSINQQLENVKIVEMKNFFDSGEESVRNYKEGIKLSCDEIIRIINLQFQGLEGIL